MNCKTAINKTVNTYQSRPVEQRYQCSKNGNTRSNPGQERHQIHRVHSPQSSQARRWTPRLVLQQWASDRRSNGTIGCNEAIEGVNKSHGHPWRKDIWRRKQEYHQWWKFKRGGGMENSLKHEECEKRPRLDMCSTAVRGRALAKPTFNTNIKVRGRQEGGSPGGAQIDESTAKIFFRSTLRPPT